MTHTGRRRRGSAEADAVVAERELRANGCLGILEAARQFIRDNE
jgi:hypothetical protein